MLFVDECLCIIKERDRVEPVGAKMGQNVLSEEGIGWNWWCEDGAKCIIGGRDRVELEVIEGEYYYYFIEV